MAGHARPARPSKMGTGSSQLRLPTAAHGCLACEARRVRHHGRWLADRIVELGASSHRRQAMLSPLAFDLAA